MRTILSVSMLLSASPAVSEVVQKGSHGFELAHSQIVPGPADEAMQAFAKVDQWWDEDHTYSGSANNMSLKLAPGACLCERLPNGGGVEHLRVTYVDPGKRLVLTGSLGPLLYEGTTGVMDVQFKPAGNGTQVTVNYKVAGFANGGADKLAPLVDAVLGSFVTRFAVYATPPVPLG